MKQFNNLTIIKSFTLIEILVVATIISLLAAGGMVSYSSFMKNSLDARRKTDLAQISAALEMYRSNVGGYRPSITFTCPPSGSLTEGSNTYLTTIPNDPKCQSGKIYSYASSPNLCNNSPTYCTSYSLTAILEDSSNYIVGPYGSSQTTPTPTP